MLQLSIAAGRPLRGLALALAAEHQYVGRKYGVHAAFRMWMSTTWAPAMKITIHTKQDAVRFDQQWRASLRTGEHSRRLTRDVEMSRWRATAIAGLFFAHEGGTESGHIDFEPEETVPHPSELSQSLGFDRVWLFPTNFAWAIRTGHEDWDRLELFEKPDSRDDGLLE